MSETETKTITGPCSEVSEKNGWTSFAIDVGSQYPVRLSTKLDPIIELGRAASRNGGAFDWTFIESQGGENPHKPGTFYTNRYLSGVEPYDPLKAADCVATPAAVPQPGGLPPAAVPPRTQVVEHRSEGMSKDEWARKDSAADKRACIAIAVSALTHTMPADPTPEHLAAFVERVKYLSHTWHVQVEAVRAGDMSDTPFLTEKDLSEIPY